jgi:methylamine---glutamate N-methyltransferase subunit A
VHNGSFSNHATIRRRLAREGIRFDSDNDSEVAARYIARRLGEGDDLRQALEAMAKTMDGFYTLLVTTPTEFAVARDPIACKPAVIAETEGYVAMASEYRALADLPAIKDAKVFEPTGVHTWTI